MKVKFIIRALFRFSPGGEGTTQIYIKVHSALGGLTFKKTFMNGVNK